MGLLDGKRLLITGVLTDKSIAYTIAERAQQEGAEIVLTGFDRGLRITQRMAGRLPTACDVLELDIGNPEHLAAVSADLKERWGELDGVLHAIAFVPGDALGGNFMTAPTASALTALEVSSISYKTLAAGLSDLLENGEGSIVGLDFDATVAWPSYDWAGVTKAALESINRYVARDLGPRGIRSNLISAGPLNTIAAKSIDGFAELSQIWVDRAPLGWDLDDATPVADTAMFLFSHWSRAISGEIIHVDGGLHGLGA